jgi:hypothetical protein
MPVEEILLAFFYLRNKILFKQKGEKEKQWQKQGID